jgi:hypothetical protein
MLPHYARLQIYGRKVWKGWNYDTRPTWFISKETKFACSPLTSLHSSVIFWFRLVHVPCTCVRYRRRLSRKRNPLGIIVLWLFAHSLIQKDRKCLLLLVVHQYYLRKCKTMLKNKNKFQNMSYKRRTATDISGVSAWYFLYRITCVERHPKKTKICITSIGDVRFCFV